MILGPCGSKKLATEAQNDLTRPHCSKYHGLGRSKEKQRSKTGDRGAKGNHRHTVLLASARGPLYKQSMVAHSPCIARFSPRLFESRAFQVFTTFISAIKTQFLLLPWHPIFIISSSNHSFSPKAHHGRVLKDRKQDQALFKGVGSKSKDHNLTIA